MSIDIKLVIGDGFYFEIGGNKHLYWWFLDMWVHVWDFFYQVDFKKWFVVVPPAWWSADDI